MVRPEACFNPKSRIELDSVRNFDSMDVVTNLRISTTMLDSLNCIIPVVRWPGKPFRDTP